MAEKARAELKFTKVLFGLLFAKVFSNQNFPLFGTTANYNLWLLLPSTIVK